MATTQICKKLPGNLKHGWSYPVQMEQCLSLVYAHSRQVQLQVVAIATVIAGVDSRASSLFLHWVGQILSVKSLYSKGVWGQAPSGNLYMLEGKFC